MSDLDEKKLEILKKELEKFKKGEKIVKRARTTPLGKLFDIISNKIAGYDSQKDAVDYLYKNFNGNPHENNRLVKREFVIDTVLDYLKQINSLSVKRDDSNIISIPLYDIRIVGELTNIIIIYGIYPIVPNGFLIPLEKRKLKNFKLPSNSSFERVDFNSDSISILKNILITFTGIFESSTDLKDLILVGTGFTDTLSIAVLFSLSWNEYSEYVQRLESLSSTFQLLSFYSMLLKNSKQNLKLSSFLSLSLSKQLMKRNGVESLIDLVLGLREDEEVDIAKINYIVQILITSKPKHINVVDYYENIFDQIYSLLVLVNRPLMVTILVEIISNIYSKNKRVIIDFLFSKVWHNLNPDLIDKTKNLDSSIIITNEVELNNSFNVCISISRSLNNNNQQIMNMFFQPIIIPLWYYANFQKRQNKDYEIVLNLLKNVIVLGDSELFINLLVSNLIDDETNMSWKFENGDNNLTFIKYNTNETNGAKENRFIQLFDKIDFNVETFIKLVSKLNDSDSKYLTQVIIDILNKLVAKHDIGDVEIPVQKIVYLKLIQLLLETFKSEIEASSISLLIFANTYFNQYFESISSKSSFQIVEDADSDDEDEDSDAGAINQDNEVLASLYPILDMISTLTPATQDEKYQLNSLQNIFKSNKFTIPPSIRPLVENINRIDTKNLQIKQTSNKFDLETILKQINDQTPSIRVYALDRLTQYTVSTEKEKAVSTKYTINLLISQLRDQEPFVYLNAIKNIVLVLSFDKSFLSHIIDIYSMSKKSIDEKLRIGEILTRFISSNGKVLNDLQIKEIINTCISISRSETESQKKKMKDNNDIRMKISALSLLGLTCYESGYAITSYIYEIADLVHGIITFEESPELRRAAVVIIHDIVRNDKGLEILKEFGEKLQILLDYISEKDQDLLVCELATETLNDIEESFRTRLNITD